MTAEHLARLRAGLTRAWRAASTREVQVLICDGRVKLWRETPDSLGWHRALHMLNTGVICDLGTGRIYRRGFHSIAAVWRVLDEPEGR